jgi:branched-subunit amino acid aminotransferase/4-amino-4-deoxychorismate lyase
MEAHQSVMKSWKLEAGQWIACDSLPLADRGFRYGMSVFETIAVSAGRPLLFDVHLERLKRAASDVGADFLGLPEFDFSQISTGLLRFYFTAGAGKPTDPFIGNVYAVFDAAEVGWNLPPIRGMTCAALYLPRPGGWKSGNYWQNVDAMAMAHRSDCGEALLFNPAGMLVSASMANVFLEIDGAWVTSSLETGARDGVVREWAMQCTGAREDFLEITSVARCTACFLTNSRYGLRSLSELDGRPLRVDISGLQQQYRNDVFPS